MFIFFHFCGRRFAAEVWDAKGLAVPTLGYEDAALRLKNGACRRMAPPNLNEARFRVSKGRRAVADPFAQQRGHRIQRKRCFAAEKWDAKGLAINTLGYGDAALRLRNGAGETMWLPSCVGTQ